MKPKKKSEIQKFISLPDHEKERIAKRLASKAPSYWLSRSRPLNAAERQQWRRFKAKLKSVK